jgi:hypothetical protein
LLESEEGKKKIKKKWGRGRIGRERERRTRAAFLTTLSS